MVNPRDVAGNVEEEQQPVFLRETVLFLTPGIDGTWHDNAECVQAKPVPVSVSKKHTCSGPEEADDQERQQLPVLLPDHHLLPYQENHHGGHRSAERFVSTQGAANISRGSDQKRLFQENYFFHFCCYSL